MNIRFFCDDPWSVKTTDFPESGTSLEKLTFLLNYAVLAPSVLGTEPWCFYVSDNSLVLRIDPARRLPVTDPEGREMMISCGAALLNLRVAAAFYGQDLHLMAFPEEQRSDVVVKATLGPRKTSAADPKLFESITKRRTSRGGFAVRPMSEDLPHRLTEAARQEGAVLSFLVDTEAQIGMLALAAEARRQQLAILAYRNELSHWVQKRVAEARDHESEAWHRLGKPSGPLAGTTPEPLDRPELATPSAAGFARMLANGADTPEDRATSDNSSVLALLATASDSKEDWLMVGQALQRVLLVAAVEDVSAAYINAPIEKEKFRRQVGRIFHVKGSPQIMLRMGTGTQRPPTPRRPMAEVVKLDS
ncbi:MAG: hypothetical protein E6Q98_05895 [Rhodospirillaceae bacterium]|nr:MAG: hypothetical protein E6Q98_05895 [Rhodospirillaceae bacterium]